MRLKIIIAVFLVCLTVINSNQSINPQNYLWIDFQARTPLINSNADQVGAQIPCVTRVGSKCSYNFKLLPYKWKGDNTGLVTMPKQDVTKDGSFLINVEVTQITGEKLDASLILEIKNGMTRVIDSDQFYRQNGVQIKGKTNQQAIKYQVSPLDKPVPDGFPTPDAVESILKSGNNDEISKIVNQVTTEYAPCRSHIKYLNEIKNRMTAVTEANKKSIDTITNDPIILQKKLTDLRIQRAQILKKLGVTATIDQINAKLFNARNQYITMKGEQNRVQRQVEIAYQNLINGDDPEDESKEQLIKSMQSATNLQAELNKWLINAVNSRNTLKKGIFDIKLLILLKNIQRTKQSQDIESEYKNATLASLQLGTKYTQNIIDALDLQQQQQESFKLQDKVNQIQQQSTSSSLIKDQTLKNSLSNENLSLKAQIENIIKASQKIQSNCA